MATPATGAPRPGINVGSTSEFSLFFHVKSGHEGALLEAVHALQQSPGYRPGDYALPIATIHMDDFASKPLKLFATIFQHVEGYDGLPDLAAVRAFILGAQVTAGGYSRNYPGTVKEIRKALRVNDAFQQVLDSFSFPPS